MVEFDKILEEMGSLSWKQKIQLVYMLIPCIAVATHMGSMVYLGHLVDKRCKFPMEKELEQACNNTWTENQTRNYVPQENDQTSECKRYDFSLVEEARNCSFWWPEIDSSANNSTRENDDRTVVSCSSWIYSPDSIFTITIASDFDLVCSDDYKRRLSQSIFMVGVTFGCVFWGEMSDRYGRKSALLASSLIGALIGSSVAFSPSYAVFVTLKSLSGFCIFAIYTTAFVLATEIVAPKNRVRIAQTTQAFFALGFCLLALYGYFVRNWRYLQVLLSAPIAVFGIYYWVVYESPRWLIANKRYTEAKIIVEKFLRSLGDKINIEEVQTLKEAAIGKQDNDDEEDQTIDDNAHTHGFIDLVRTRNMRSKSLKLFYCWMVCSCVYYGLTFNSSDIGGDPFINLFLSGLVEIPAVFLCIPVLENWGRRPTLSFSLILSGIACVGMLFVPKDLLWLNITLSMIGKFAIAGSFGTVYIFAAELYPTPIRNVGIGVCSSFARVGAILSPVIAMLSHVSEPLPYVVFGIMSIVGGLLALFLPEVLGIRLPETLEEGEEFGKDQISPLVQIFAELGCCKTESIQRSNGHFAGNQYQEDVVEKAVVEEQKV